MGVESIVFWMCGLGVLSGLLMRLAHELHMAGLI